MDATSEEELLMLCTAAERGDAAAQASLGIAYELGLGVERDVLHATYLYRQSALAGEPRAQFSLGLAYESGAGTEPNAGLARYWFKKAASQGYAMAVQRLRSLDSASSASTARPHDSTTPGVATTMAKDCQVYGCRIAAIGKIVKV